MVLMMSKTLKDQNKNYELAPKHKPYKRSKDKEQYKIERGVIEDDGNLNEDEFVSKTLCIRPH